MSFSTSLTGLNAATSNLDVISNNIANASTTGFKRSRAEFGDVYALGTLGSSKTAIGTGVVLNRVSQQHTQGPITNTGNGLDLAISGDGFFVLTPTLGSDEKIFSRAGAFGVNKDGFVINGTGALLQGFPVNPDGSITSISLENTNALRLPASAGAPQATTTANISLNLQGDEAVIDLTTVAFDPSDSTTFTISTSQRIFDSQGAAHTINYFFRKDAAVSNAWEVRITLDGNTASDEILPVDGSVVPPTAQPFRLAFDAQGAIDPLLSTNGGLFGPLDEAGSSLATINPAANDIMAGGTPPVNPSPLTLASGANPLTLSFDFRTDTTQFVAPFLVNRLEQDGFTTGRLSGIDISDNGVVRANFTNGQAQALGKIALARFGNQQGLVQIGNTAWRESLLSGTPIPGEADTGVFGSILSTSLESSNVNLTDELVALIAAQRDFQANARGIETSNTLTQTIINIR